MPAPDLSKTALLVIDFQNDFCPPHGSLAVPNARDAIPVINHLLTLPFALKLASKDHHPPNHISFASVHPAPDNVPFISTATIANPLNPAETVNITLWPDHCVEGTPGAELVAELDTAKLDAIIIKGTDPRTEMFSAFRDVFSSPSGSHSRLEALLRDAQVERVVLVGVTAEYCVKWSAHHAAELGFATCVVREGVRAVDDGEHVWETLAQFLCDSGVALVGAAEFLGSLAPSVT